MVMPMLLVACHFQMTQVLMGRSSKNQSFMKEGWPNTFSEELKDFKKLENSLSTENGCPVYDHILALLHLGHFGMQRMKQLTRSTVYSPGIDLEIEDIYRKCTSFGQFQNKPTKPLIHPWMMPKKPWSRLYLDHAINFLGRNWLVLVFIQQSQRLRKVLLLYLNKNLLVSGIPIRW